MKIFYYLLSIFFLTVICANETNAQITITSEHMPQIGDTVRISQSTSIDLPDPALTGFNYNWDYSSLVPASQTVLNFINPNQTPPLYQIIFNFFVTNLAVPLQQLDFINFEVTDAYAYYKNSASEYTNVGYAATFMGVPVPMKYNEAERYYKFPLSQNSVPDSTNSSFTIQYPQVAFFSLERKRVNSVDGEGTLTTPYGTFEVLRVKSVITEHDSLYIDSLQMGAPIIRNIIEYRWLSPQFPVPVLTITQEGLTYNVQYIDSVHNLIPLSVTCGENKTICEGQSSVLTAQASGGFPPYTYLWSTSETTQSITVSPLQSGVYSVIASDSKGNIATASNQVTVIPFEIVNLGNDTSICADHNLNFNLNSGYENLTWFINDQVKGTGNTFTIDSTGNGLGSVTLKVVYQSGICSASDEIEITFQVCNALNENAVQQLNINPNPASNYIAFESSKGNQLTNIQITALTGKIVKTFTTQLNKERIVIDISHLEPGMYLINGRQNEHIIRGKFIKK